MASFLFGFILGIGIMFAVLVGVISQIYSKFTKEGVVEYNGQLYIVRPAKVVEE